tara:strand:+ start:617 stop:850 length:234 start_codon:yes stop_codon:yes gene_type:complete
MAGSIMVKYVKKTYKQLQLERSGSHAQMNKQMNHSVDVDSTSFSYMTFDNMKDANRFASDKQEEGYHIIEVINESRY